MAVTCILPQMLPITAFPNPEIKGNPQLLPVLGIRCSLKYLSRAQRAEQRRIRTCGATRAWEMGTSLLQSLIAARRLQHLEPLLEQQNNLDVVS